MKVDFFRWLVFSNHRLAFGHYQFQVSASGKIFYEFVGAGLKPARSGSGLVRQNVEARNERLRAGLKPAPTEKCPNPGGVQILNQQH